MDKCIYNGEIIYAFDVAKKYDFEKEVRNSRNQLFCCDPDCNSPVRYKHGEIRFPHFSHINADKVCVYDMYNRKSGKIFKNLKQILVKRLLEIAESQNISIDVDVKINKNSSHFTPIIVNHNLAIDIIDKRVSSKILSDRLLEYKQLNYYSQQIIIDTIQDRSLYERMDIYFPKKFELNESIDNTAIIYDKNTYKFAIYKLDTFDYSYNGVPLDIKYQNVFTMMFSIDDLYFEDNRIKVKDFEKAYSIWFEEKQLKFQSYINHAKIKEEQNRKPKVFKTSLNSNVDRNNNISYFRNSKNVGNNHLEYFEKMSISDLQDKDFYRNHRKFKGSFIKGKYELFDLTDIKPQKCSNNYFKKFTLEDMKKKLEQIFCGDANALKAFLNKMYNADDEEKSIFLNIYKSYKMSSYSMDWKIEILEYIIKEADIL